MNAKGTRFLAVLAVMAMAFAAFAVVDLADATASYSNRTISFDDGEVNTTLADGDIVSAGGAYYVESDMEVTVTATAPVVFFLVDGAELTITGGTNADTIVGVYSAQKMSNTSTTSTTALKLTVKNGLKDACLTDVTTSGAKFQVPTDLTGFYSLADLDLPIVATNVYTIKNGAATIEANANFTIPVGWTLKANVEFQDDGVTMTMPGMFEDNDSKKHYTTYEGTVSYLLSSVKLVLAAAEVSEIAAGSVEISGVFTGEGLKAAISEAAGDVVLTDVTVTSGTVAINTEVTITSLTIEQGATVALNVTPAEGSDSITVEGTLNQGTGVDITDLDIDGNGTVNNAADASDMEQLIVKGRSADGPIVFPAYQQVVVETTWTLVAGAHVTIMGELIVPEGTKIVVSHDARLIIDNNAIVTVYGDIVVEDDEGDEDYAPGMMWVKTGTVGVYGTLDIEGILDVEGEVEALYGAVVAYEGGLISVDDTGELWGDECSKLIISADSALYVEGSLAIDTVYNYGLVTINSTVPALDYSVINQMANGASVAVLNFTAKKIVGEDEPMYGLVITDANYIVYSKDGADYTVLNCTNGAPNTVLIQPEDTVVGYVTTISDIYVIQNMTVSAGVADTTGYLPQSQKNYANSMSVSGAPTLTTYYDGDADDPADSHAAATVLLDGERKIIVDADDELEVGDDVTVANIGILDVKGSIDASLYGTNVQAAFLNVENVGTVTVLGDGIIMNCINQLKPTLNAVEYKSGLATAPVYVYVSMDTALDIANNGLVQKFNVYGTNYVTKDNMIPDGAEFTLKNNPTVQVGSATNTDILLYIEDEGVIKGAGTIDVYASMYAETSASVKNATVISDVKSVEMNGDKPVRNGWVLWTNLAKALNTAQPGDTVTISRESEFVVIAVNTEIKEGVTLKAPAEYAALFLNDGVTLTVNGTLDTEKDVYAQTKFDEKAKILVDDKSSAIIVNGILKTTKDTNFGFVAGAAPAIMSAGAPISGAYFSVEGVDYITSLEIAVTAVDDIDDQITIYGTVNAGVIYFEAGDTCNSIIIGNGVVVDATRTIATALTVDDLVLDGTKVKSTAAEANQGTLSGDIIAGEGMLTVSKIKGDATVYTISDKSDKLTLEGKILGSSLKVAAGTAYTASGVNVATTSASVASGATLSANGNNGIINTLTVDGALVVPNGKGLNVTTMTLNGSFDVATETQTAGPGALEINTLYAGIKNSDYHAAVPSMNGPFTLGTLAAVIAGANADDEAQAVLDACFSSDFIVEGKLWFTIYKVAAGNVNVNKAPIENAFFEGWVKDLAGNVAPTYNPAIGGNTAGSHTTWYAAIDYSVYTVTIYSDAGIKSIAIDGVQMMHEGAVGSNVFVTVNPIEAGVHTVSYTYEKDYTGSVNLYTMDNTILKDLKFTVSGTPEDFLGLFFEYQLYGSEQAVEPTPEPEPTPEVKEWTITTILLLILVILIAVMAVIVALRLNRN